MPLIPLEIFENSKKHLQRIAEQINNCYNIKAYDACFILLRKLTEVLIIEIFEEYKLESTIKDSDGNYLMLKKLISSFQNERSFSNINNRNVKESLPKIKKNGDLSAHNRTFIARKGDIDRLRDDFRIVFELFINSLN